MNAHIAIDQRSLLQDTMEEIRGFPDSSDYYFSQIGRKLILNPVAERSNVVIEDDIETIPAKFFDQLGIRSVTLNRSRIDVDVPAMIAWSAGQYKWHAFREPSLVEILRSMVRDSPVISFSDWVSVEGASELWDGFLYDVIKPLKRRDINFIFYLGNPTKKRSFEVDEIIDIISGYSAHGNVSFLIHEDEADELCKVFRGAAPGSPAFRENAVARYQCIFDAMKIDRLLVYSAARAVVLSHSIQFVLPGRASQPVQITQDGKNHFNAGYSHGLLLQLDVAHCLALGLVSYGTYLDSGTGLTRNAMLDYLGKWVDALEG